MEEPCRRTEHSSKLSLACTPSTQLPLALGPRMVVILTPISQGSGSADGIPDEPPLHWEVWQSKLELGLPSLQ